jgi:hypothetical protein
VIDLTTAQFLVWADEHIPAYGGFGLEAKFEEEVEEFLLDICGDEAADVLFCLVRICQDRGIDLAEAARRKFEVLQQRRYELMPNGTWHHVKESA